jgi:hypothetical protein
MISCNFHPNEYYVVRDTMQPSFHRFPLLDVNPLSGHTKTRIIYAPNDAMREEHASIIRFVRNLGVPMPNASGCIPGGSPLRNVLRHRTPWRTFPEHFYLADIRGAYRHVSIPRLADVLAELRGDISLTDVYHSILSEYCEAQEGGLVTGGPASSYLFNVYCEVLLDRYIRVLAEKYKLTYSRYLDDMTFSSHEPIGTVKRRALRHCVEAAGFTLNDRKTEIVNLRRQKHMVINGVGVEYTGRLFLPRHALPELLELLKFAVTRKQLLFGYYSDQIHGRMGTFKALTNLRHPNATEREVLAFYAQFRTQQFG